MGPEDVMSGLYVDDGMIFAETENAFNLQGHLKGSFDITVCSPKTHIGIQIEHDKENHCIFIHQKNYIERILAERSETCVPIDPHSIASIMKDKGPKRRAIDVNTVDIEEIKIRLDKLEELRQSLEESLMELSVHDKEVTEAQLEQEITSYEEKYVHLKLICERIIKERVGPALVINLNQSNVVPTVTFNDLTSRVTNAHARLPKINLLTFSGAYEEWHSFFGIFDSLIHSNDTLNDIQKFHYLKSALKDDEAKAIESLKITGVNYSDAWSKVLKKENSVALRSLLDGTLKHTRALAALKRP
ncbi:PREDICTED: uncharacterized protein LOC108758463 [Trachymyrmex cornetzi]|uniref:uncharacterized protein LOC108758463 n=1 Tax=Trachymyrmex cornetzi TaxID=471704 RepID=UPI00084F79C2|nr:PREDICTED: uncharacterized protein LOC108758463 [Trachymyrmex cornetzi]